MSLFDSEIPDEISTDEKLNRITKQLIKDPDSSSLNEAYSRILLDESPNLKRAKIALKSLDIVLSQEPENWDAKMLVIRALRWMERYDEALLMAKEMSKKFNSSALICTEIGKIYSAKNEPDMALIQLKEGIKNFPNDGKIMRTMIEVLVKLSGHEKNSSKLEDALIICNRGLNDCPNEKKFASSKIHVLVRMGKYDEMVKHIEEFQKKYPDEFYSPMWTYKNNITSVALQSAQVYNYVAKKNRKDPTKFLELLERSNNLIDISLDNFNENMKVWLELKLDNLIEQKKWKESLVICDEVIGVEIDMYNLFNKMYLLYRLDRFEESLKLSQDLLDDQQSKYQELQIRIVRNSCLIKLDKKEESHMELEKMKLLRDDTTNQKESEKMKKEKQEPATNDTLDRIEEKIDRLGTNMPESDDYYFNNADRPFKNETEKIARFEKMKNIVSLNDDYITIRYFHDLDQQVEFENLKITKIRLMQKVYSYQQKGSQFFSQFRGLVRGIESFNKEHNNCQIEYKVFFTEKTEVNLKDKFHRRYLFDNDTVYEMPGNDQISKFPKYDSMIKCDPEASDIIRKGFGENWQKAESATLNKTFMTKFVRYLFKKENGCHTTIEEEHPDIVLKIKKEFEDEEKLKDEKKCKAEKKPDYIKDESTILHNVEQIISKKPGIIDDLKQNPEEIDQALSKIMAETKGEKMDPDIVKKILKEKTEQ